MKKNILAENLLRFGAKNLSKSAVTRLTEQEQEAISLQEDLDYITELVESFKTNVYKSDAMENLIRPDSRTIASGIDVENLMRFASKVYTTLKNQKFKLEKAMKNPNLTPAVTATWKEMLYKNLLYLIRNNNSDFAKFKDIVDENTGVDEGEIDASVAKTWKSSLDDRESDIQARYDAAKELKKNIINT